MRFNKRPSHQVERVLIDIKSLTNILYKSTFQLNGALNDQLVAGLKPLINLLGDTLYSLGTIPLDVKFDSKPCSVSLTDLLDG
jgi:hypothetical protein